MSINCQNYVFSHDRNIYIYIYIYIYMHEVCFKTVIKCNRNRSMKLFPRYASLEFHSAVHVRKKLSAERSAGSIDVEFNEQKDNRYSRR